MLEPNITQRGERFSFGSTCSRFFNTIATNAEYLS